MDTIRAFVDKFDRYQRGHNSAGFIFGILKKYNEDEGGYRAALLAYYGFLSLFPLVLVFVSLTAIFARYHLAFGAASARLITSYLPIIGADLQRNVRGVGGSGIALVLGLCCILYGARYVMNVLGTIMDRVWVVPVHKRINIIEATVRSLGAIIVSGIGLSVSSFLSSLTFWHSGLLAPFSVIVACIVLFFTLLIIFWMIGSVRRRFWFFWLSALLTAVGAELLQLSGGLIISAELHHLASLYGSLAIVLGLLFWLYLLAQVMVYALEIDAVRRLKLWPRSLNGPLTEADKLTVREYRDR